MSQNDVFPHELARRDPRCTADGVVLFGGSNPGQGELEKYVDEKPERRTFDGLSNFEPVTKPVREFTQNEFEGWGRSLRPERGMIIRGVGSSEM